MITAKTSELTSFTPSLLPAPNTQVHHSSATSTQNLGAMLPFYKVAYCHEVLKPKPPGMFAPYMLFVWVTLPHCQYPNYKALKDKFPKLSS
jgi:hypothetical protein